MKVYFDNNATTPLHPEVKKEMIAAMEMFGNPSSMHAFGREARANVEDARRKVAHFIGANEKEIIFVGSGSEANNTVLSLFVCGSSSAFQVRKCAVQLLPLKLNIPVFLRPLNVLGIGVCG